MNIAIIDDDPISIFLTEMSLEKEGVWAKLKSFMSAEEALQVLEAHSLNDLPDVILLDLNMPIINGWQFLEIFQHLPAAKLQGKCAVYILTSSLDTADTVKAGENALVKGIIHKPITPEDIGVILLSN
ncbi:response regulator [Pontibacter sp. 172403-2]|uniref:response regulator n=1 Tax=Pontibacter rufus TaxID=2791028 RepID=UPI0018AFFC09|nr:response regulator [Pontibacter sp. 172403-2]MBF9255805.1 response regulator [Pontibacter sp. 172403-2]